MDHECPYRKLPDESFWRRSIGGVGGSEVDPVVAPGFTIAATDRIATAGSCFAQHIAHALQRAGFSYLVTESFDGLVDPDIQRRHGYGVFTARFGNVYTTRQLVQLIERAYGVFDPTEPFWEEGGGWVDPFRPFVQPNGFGTLLEAELDRRSHLAAVRAMCETADVFVFTLGLTETWLSTDDGAAFPVCPGCGAGRFDPERYRFHNLSVGEVVADLDRFLTLLREQNPSVKVLLTVSPVPLVATMTDRSVLTATTYSKSVLRVAADDVARRWDAVAYFPSYEVITGQHSRGAYYEDDLREVRPEGVAHVMRLFLRHYCGVTAESPEPGGSGSAATPTPTASQQLADIICDEEQLEAAALG